MITNTLKQKTLNAESPALNSITFSLYLILFASIFLNIPSRIPIMGYIRFEFFLGIFIGGLCLLNAPKITEIYTRKIIVCLSILLAYIIITIPVVEWPGSVVRNNLPQFLKQTAFFFFTIILVRDKQRLKIFITLFMLCQIFRVLEPLYLHLTEGYWGSKAHIGLGNFQDRLSGSPADIINPNGVGYITVCMIPFIYYLWLPSSFFLCSLGLSTLPFIMYALKLTGSRSAAYTLVLAIGIIFWKSHKKFILLIALSIGAVFAFNSLSELQKDRYFSLFNSENKNYATAIGRIHGLYKHINLGLSENVFFGHGIGTSLEASTHKLNTYLIAHNAYAEALIELGIIGLFIYLYFLKIIWDTLRNTKAPKNSYLEKAKDATQVYFYISLFFAMASAAVSSYIFYLIAGLCCAIKHISDEEAKKLEESSEAPSKTLRNQSNEI